MRARPENKYAKHLLPRQRDIEKQENNTANQGINLVYPDKGPFPAILRRLALSDFQTTLDEAIGQLKQNIS